ncbi:MAG: hypothetical protein D6788_05680, partial [Planctomycetota bacterium]
MPEPEEPESMDERERNMKRHTTRGSRIAGGIVEAVLAVVLAVWAPPTVRAQSPQEKETEDAVQPAQPPEETPVEPSETQPSPEVVSERINQLLRGIDPKKINLSGAELDVEVVGDQLILRGNESDLDVIEALVRVIQATKEQKELRVVTVSEKDANDIARTAGEALRDMLRRPNQRPEDEVVVTALSPNILLVSALPQDIDFVVETIQAVDAVKEELPPVEQLVFPIKNRRASDVAKQLEDILKKIQEKKGQTGVKSEIQIIPNDANNTIMVLAAETEREKIQKLLKELDVEPVAGWGEVKLTFFPLLHSKANELADVITELLRNQTDREAAEEVIYRMQISKALPSGKLVELPPINLQRPTRILPDTGSNSLIVATVEENVGPIGELIRLLDGVPTAEEVHLRLFPLRFADAESLAQALEEMFDKGKQLPEDPDGSGADAVPAGDLGKAVSYNVSIVVDQRTNTIVVTGRMEQLDLAEKVVKELDRPATALKFPLRFIRFEHTDATNVGEIIKDLFDQRFQALEATNAGPAALERERVFLSADLRSNSLIVSASEENYEEILSLAKQLDTVPAKLFDQIRIIRLERLNATNLKDKIEELWQRKAELRRVEERFEDLPVIVVDERSNALLIASSIEDFQEIQRLVGELESQPLIEMMELFKLEYADASVLADMLKQLFDDLAGRSEAFEAPIVLADPRSNALIVAGTRDGMERAAELIHRLDVEAGPLTAVFRVYPLEHASAAALAPRMQELFDSRREGEQIARTPVVILPDEASNSLVCSASRDDQEVIVELLGLLDRPSSLAKQFAIFPLKQAKAPAVADKLESLFQSQAEGAGTGRTDAIATEADERTNSIIVWASPTQMENIREVIKRLDTAAPVRETMMKVIQLRQALAEDFADLLNRTLVGEDAGTDEERAMIVAWAEKLPDGKERIRKLLKQDIKVEADPRTNSLLVMAPSDSMEMLEAMIRDFDSIRPVRSEIRLFPLVNSDAQTMVDQLTEIFQPQGGDGEQRSQLVFGDIIGDQEVASVGQELRFAADTRTNTLIAAGAEVDLRMVEELVRYLDSQEVEDRVKTVLQTKYVDPSQIASAIQNFNQQEQDVLSEVGGEEAARVRAERQISVESVGTEEQGSQRLIIGTSRRTYPDVMRMIDELDQPEPQVRISVLIAEVTLSDSTELGVEIAGQDLSFTESSIVGPNGVIKGSDFDFVGGTTLGALGSGLGFNFTIVGEDFSFLLHALQQNTRLEILSRPTILVRNGDEGNISIADQVPIITSSQVSDTGAITNSTGREDVGIILTVTPQISPDGYVTIQLDQEISNVSGENIQLSEGVTQPVFSTREVQTNVTVRDGETIVIGGLITSRRSEGKTKVPLVGDLPLVGPFFRTTNVSETKTELLIIMTVDILRTDEEAREMSIAERDRFVLPDTIRQSPLLEGLRIRPDESLMGPRRDLGPTPPAKENEQPEA